MYCNLSRVKGFIVIDMKLITKLLTVILIVLTIGCSSTKSNLIINNEKNYVIHVIIDNEDVYKHKQGIEFIGILKDCISKNFNNVSIVTGHTDLRIGEILIKPKSFSHIIYGDIRETQFAVGEGSYKVDSNTEVLVRNTFSSDIYKVEGSGESMGVPSLAGTPFVIVRLALSIASLGATEKANDALRESNAITYSLESIAIKINNILLSSIDIEQYSKLAIVSKSLPSALTLIASYSDTSAFLPNNTLDAGEHAEILVKVKNTGKGAGYGTILEVNADNPKITCDKEIVVGDIQPGEEKEMKVNLKAGLDIADGKTSVQLNLKEKRGYDARKVVYQLKTARLEKPRIEIVSTEINDGDSGLAKGNGNGIPESGETVELTAFIRNNGEGKAIGVNLNGDNLTSGVQWVRNSTLVGTIPPGELVKAKLAFAIPRNFDAKEIASALKVSDVRGVSDAVQKVSYAFGRLSPDVRYAWRVYLKGKPVENITNGEEYEAELTLSNNGKIIARNVTANLTTSGGAILSRSRIEVGELKVQTTLPGQRLTLTVPRTYTEGRVSLGIEIAQADFPAQKTILDIPVAVKSPKLKYIATLRSRGGGATLEQGEQAILELQVANEGNLPAEGVSIKVESKDENLKILGKTEEHIGKVSQQVPSETVKFQLATTKRIKPGTASLAVTIGQSDFGQVDELYALNIREEGAEIIDIASDDSAKPTDAKGEKRPGPAITLKSRITETDAERVSIAFDVADEGTNIDASSVKLMVNGVAVPLDASTGLTPKPERKKGVMANISLREGENRIVITARNADYAQTTKECLITRSSEDDVDIPPVTGVTNPDAVAVVIGISKYKNKEMPPVDYARRDAETVRSYLVRTLGYDSKRIFEAYDEDADRTSIVAALYDDLKSRVVPGKSDVFIYYSGHGMPDVNSEGAVKDAYLAPYDFRSTSTQRTGIAVKELYEQMEKLGARSVTVVMDACFSGTTEKGSLIKGISAVLEVSNPMLKVKNGTIFTASASKEAARWYDKKRHGLFTYYFLQGMRGKADTDGDGMITKKELEIYVKQNVAEQSQFRQNPTALGSPDAVVVRLK